MCLTSHASYFSKFLIVFYYIFLIQFFIKYKLINLKYVGKRNLTMYIALWDYIKNLMFLLLTYI